MGGTMFFQQPYITWPQTSLVVKRHPLCNHVVSVEHVKHINLIEQSHQPIPWQPRIHAAEYVAQMTDVNSENAQRVTTSEIHAASFKGCNLNTLHSCSALSWWFYSYQSFDVEGMTCNILLRYWTVCQTGYDSNWHSALQSTVSSMCFIFTRPVGNQQQL